VEINPKVQKRYSPGQLPRALARTALYAGLWWVLTSGDPESWIIGGPAVILAGIAAYLLSGFPHWRWRLNGVVFFLPFFLWRSFVGGIDVARRALHPKRPLVPGFVDYHMRFTHTTARVFMINTISLLPGTLSVNLTGDKLTVHALDTDLPVLSELKTLESRVADLFGLQTNKEVDKKGDGVD
jgi:multicomponent Na+:H+ antiporter subunit E